MRDQRRDGERGKGLASELDRELDKSFDKAFDPSRRRLLAGLAAGATAGTGLVACSSSDNATVAPSAGTPSGTLPAPASTGIDHIVVVMMENRSFDHYLGWLPGANGRQGVSLKDSDGKPQTGRALAPDYQNCGSADPDHSYDGGRKQLNNGAMDGFLLTQPAGDTFPIGYYTAADLPFFSRVASDWTICDHYFSGILSSTFPNRVYMHAGQTDRNSNSFDISKLPTVWDSLAAAGYSGRYYFHDEPITALWGGKYLGITRQSAQFKLDAATGRLPNVAYIDPAFLGESGGISKDDHPLADIRDGQALLGDIYETLRTSPQWSRTLLIVNYDEWGGFYDHVEPPFAPVSAEEVQATGNDGRLGFRVPCAIIGPRARRGHVESIQFDPNSILNFIAWRFGFAPLGVRGSSFNLAHALDFSAAPNTDAPAYDVPQGPFGTACTLSSVLPAGTSTLELDTLQRRQAEHLLDWEGLHALARRYGFPV